MQEYRAGELLDFKKKYFEEWRRRIRELPDVTYEMDYTEL